MYFVGIALTLLTICDIGTSFYISRPANGATFYEMVKRSAWGAKEPKFITPRKDLPYYVMVQHTMTPECSSLSDCSAELRLMQNFHMTALGWTDIGYSFLIGGDGRVYQGRGWDVKNTITNRWYKKSLTIGFVGDFSDREPSDAMMIAARNLIDCGKAEGWLPDYVRVIALQQVMPTGHPANSLLRRIQEWPESMPGRP